MVRQVTSFYIYLLYIGIFKFSLFFFFSSWMEQESVFCPCNDLYCCFTVSSSLSNIQNLVFLVAKSEVAIPSKYCCFLAVLQYCVKGKNLSGYLERNWKHCIFNTKVHYFLLRDIQKMCILLVVNLSMHARFTSIIPFLPVLIEPVASLFGNPYRPCFVILNVSSFNNVFAPSSSLSIDHVQCCNAVFMPP